VSSKLLRSWRVLVLSFAVLLAPQMSIVHALSHSLPGGAPHSGEGDKRGHAPAKVCDSCLALAQLGAALPSTFQWLALETSPPSHRGFVPVVAPARSESAYAARAPPVALS
jgi:hypothetical protein